MQESESRDIRQTLSKPRVQVVFSDGAIVVVDKPPGVSAVHDANRPDDETAIEQLEARFGRVYTVHRLDRDTSGVFVVAMTPESHAKLSAQFEAHTTKKRYLCLVRGHPTWDMTIVDEPLRANTGRHYRTVVDEKRGQPSRTGFEVVERFRGFTVIEARPHEGRRHQIRAHLVHAGLPIVADPIYGDGQPLLLSTVKRGYRPSAREERPLLNRLGLHALSVEFDHPVTKERVTHEVPPPADFSVALKQLRRWARL